MQHPLDLVAAFLPSARMVAFGAPAAALLDALQLLVERGAPLC